MSTLSPSTKRYRLCHVIRWHPRCYFYVFMKLFLATEELRVHGETDVERIGTRADADTERLAEEDVESAEERRRSAYRLT